MLADFDIFKLKFKNHSIDFVLIIYIRSISSKGLVLWAQSLPVDIGFETHCVASTAVL